MDLSDPQPQATPMTLSYPEEDLAKVGGSVTMSRALAESAHGLTLNEARVMMLAMRAIDPRFSPYKYDRTGSVKVRVTAAEFAQLAGLAPGADGYTPRAAYDGLKAACSKLYERSASWTEGKRQIRMRWAWKTVYHEGEAWADELGYYKVVATPECPLNLRRE